MPTDNVVDFQSRNRNRDLVDRLKKAKRIEIAARHRRKKPSPTKLERVLSMRCSQLTRLFNDRDELHNDDIGRTNLQILLELGLTGPMAKKVAPWISAEELRRLIEHVDAYPRHWTAAALGNRVELTFEEKIRLDIRHVDCCDRPKGEVAAFYRKRKNNRDIERRRRKRAGLRSAPEPIGAPPKNSIDVDECAYRAQAIHHALIDREWLSVRLIANRVRAWATFRNLDDEGLRQAIHRALRELANGGLVEIEKRPGQRGLQVKFARRLDMVENFVDPEDPVDDDCLPVAPRSRGQLVTVTNALSTVTTPHGATVTTPHGQPLRHRHFRP
jgi:hypothetical protein